MADAERNWVVRTMTKVELMNLTEWVAFCTRKCGVSLERTYQMWETCETIAWDDVRNEFVTEVITEEKEVVEILDD